MPEPASKCNVNIIPHRRCEFTERKKPEREREELIIELQKASDEFYGKEDWYIEMKNEEHKKIMDMFWFQ